ADGLLSRLQLGSRRAGRRAGDDERGRHRIHPDPQLELPADRGSVRDMSGTLPSSATPKIEMRGVAKAFGAKKVLRGIDLDVARGSSTVIIGGSGTGKSVLLKCVLGIVRPDAGTIRVDGEDVRGLRGRSRERLLDKFGMLFQGGALFDSLPVWQNVAFRLLQGGGRKPRAEAREIAIEKLRRVGLQAETADLFPAELSGGMQKRVGLARAIAAEPEIIFFDEPTTGLDPIMADVINDLIREIVVEMGATAMTITH